MANAGPPGNRRGGGAGSGMGPRGHPDESARPSAGAGDRRSVSGRLGATRPRARAAADHAVADEGAQPGHRDARRSFRPGGHERRGHRLAVARQFAPRRHRFPPGHSDRRAARVHHRHVGGGSEGGRPLCPGTAAGLAPRLAAHGAGRASGFRADRHLRHLHLRHVAHGAEHHLCRPAATAHLPERGPHLQRQLLDDRAPRAASRRPARHPSPGCGSASASPGSSSSPPRCSSAAAASATSSGTSGTTWTSPASSSALA